MFTALLAGLGLGFSLIIAIGAQNLFVLRQGLRRENVIVIAAICALSDAALIALGVSGIGAALTALPWLVEVIRWAGAAFLVSYGIIAARRAWRPSGEVLDARGHGRNQAHGAAPAPQNTSAPELYGTATSTTTSTATATATARSTTRTPLAAAVLTTLALTWLNPHVYLDTVFLLGSVANTHGDLRWIFGIGAMAASVIWFFGLGFGARYLSRWLASPRAWRILDAVIAAVMIGLGISLVLP